jgi:hypothetical protein
MVNMRLPLSCEAGTAICRDLLASKIHAEEEFQVFGINAKTGGL